MTVNNPPKALIVMLGLVCITVLMAINRIDTTAGAGMLGTIIGYAVGNGIAARNGEQVEPLIGTRPELPEPSGWSPGRPGDSG